MGNNKKKKSPVNVVLVLFINGQVGYDENRYLTEEKCNRIKMNEKNKSPEHQVMIYNGLSFGFKIIFVHWETDLATIAHLWHNSPVASFTSLPAIIAKRPLRINGRLANRG